MYPHLCQCLVLLWIDNLGPQASRVIKDPREWPSLLARMPLVEHAELQASTLLDHEKETLVSGEHEEQRKMVRDLQCAVLDQFILEIFDGKFVSVFDK